MAKKKNTLDKADAINQIADDWLLIHPTADKSQWASILNSIDDEHVQEIFSFHQRIQDFDANKKREILRDSPKMFHNELSNMHRAYTEEIERAKHAYYILDKPYMSDADFDILEKLVKITLEQQKQWKEFFDRISIRIEALWSLCEGAARRSDVVARQCLQRRGRDRVRRTHPALPQSRCR